MKVLLALGVLLLFPATAGASIVATPLKKGAADCGWDFA